MGVEISVGPPILTINQGNTFMVSGLDGEIAAESECGIFSNDTRFVNYLATFTNGEPWTRLSSAAIDYHVARIFCTNKDFLTEEGLVPANTISLNILRDANENGICERIYIENHGLRRVRFMFEVALRSDFADIFEVRAHRFIRRGRIETVWNAEAQELIMRYDNHDFHRRFIYKIITRHKEVLFANGRISFELLLDPGERWRCDNRYELLLGQDERTVMHPVVCEPTELELLHQRWAEHATKLTSANEDVYRLYKQSVDDLGALRLYEEAGDPDRWLPAAGVPWYVTVFGRDSLIISLQTLLVNSNFASGALERLAEYQAGEVDDERDAEPGKIMHEIRYGELAHFKKIPHTPYYGTADATPLYLIALHDTWKWTGDEQLLKRFRDVAMKCLSWIDKYGDLDGDGFQEYKTRSSLGYENMNWKDSPDSVVYPDGTTVGQPKALCELQGYVFDAWVRMAEVFTALGEQDLAETLMAKAAALKKRFEERFWCPEIDFYAYALDKDKHQVKTVASNIGHCLWSGIISRDKALAVVRKFLQPDMWSGWGIRTLSALNPAYNPHSYHNGSVWPHDNGIIALGFKRYGFAREAAMIARDISEAASYFSGYRLPELYAGIQRSVHTFPVQYPGANVPQGWAAGAVFHLLQALLGLQADVPHNKLMVDPALPDWLPEVILKGMTVGGSEVDLKFWKDGKQTKWDAAVVKGNKLEVIQQVWTIPDFTEK